MQSAADLSHELMDDDDEVEESWQVQVAQGDVRTLSLEQLDDFYRLSIIDDETQVWNPGMVRWASLGSVLGLDAEPEAKGQPAAADSSAVRSQAPESAPARRVDGPMRTSTAQSGMMERVRQPHAQPSAASRPPVSLASASSWPPVSEVSPASLPLSLAPLVFSVPPPALPREKLSRGTVGLLGFGLALVALAGAVRNDVVLGAADAFGSEASYLGVEAQMLGAPSFGTPRAVKALVAKYADVYRTVEVPSELLRKTPVIGSNSSEAANDDSASDAPSNRAVRKSRPSSSGRPSPRVERSTMGDPMKTQKSKHPARKGDEYDPLNPTL